MVEACLNRKSCRVVCPAGIDVSEEILKKRAQHPNPLAGAIFWLQDQQALFETLLSLLGLSQPLWDRPLGRALLDHLTRPMLKLLASTARIPKEMILPRMAVKNLRQRYAHLTEESGRWAQVGAGARHPPQAEAPPVTGRSTSGGVGGTCRPAGRSEEPLHRTGRHIETVAYFHGWGGGCGDPSSPEAWGGCDAAQAEGLRHTHSDLWTFGEGEDLCTVQCQLSTPL